MAEGQPSTLSGTFQKPFTQQVAFWRQKLGNRVPTARWDDLKAAEHDTAFMVAGATKADLLSDLAAAVDRGIAEGKGLETFRKDFRSIVERQGWHGWTGDDSKAGRAWRTRTIYRTNASTSYAAGRYAQLVEGDFPFWVYRHGGSVEPRIVHLGWNGLVLEPSHAFWRTHYPPSAWGCSCYVLGARSMRAAIRLGGDPEKQLQPNWNAIDPKTGAPIGIGKGWGYAPGARVAELVSTLAEKIRHWDYRIAKGFMEEVPEAARDALAQSYRSLPSVADDAARYAARAIEGVDGLEPARTLGLVTSEQAAAIGRIHGDAKVGLFDFSLTPTEIKHVAAMHGNDAAERSRGQRAVEVADFAQLPSILLQPDQLEDAGTSDIGEPLVRFSRQIGDDRFNAIFAVRKGRRTLALKTMFINAGKSRPPR